MVPPYGSDRRYANRFSPQGKFFRKKHFIDNRPFFCLIAPLCDKSWRITMSTEKRADLNLRIARLPIVDQCEGCQRIVEDAGAKVCGKYAEPAFHWEDGQICLMATHIKKEVTIVKKAVNPLKASKRAAGKKK